MQKIKHYNIPIFIPELACPHQCAFCNQQTISGAHDIPAPEDVPSVIDQYLPTMQPDAHIEVAFFGGSFTGIDIKLQEAYLQQVLPYIEGGRIRGVRLSTRPDYIDEPKLDLLKKYRVTSIELGAQSMNDEVLRRAARGHESEDTIKAAHLIKSYNFELGLQMMIGLPGSTSSDAMQSAKDYVALKAETTRIYPTLVIKNTLLERWYRAERYRPLTMEEAVDLTARLTMFFDEHGVKVLRTGLHPSKDLLDGSGYVAGPFHPSFKELVQTKIWHNLLSTINPKPGVKNLECDVPTDQLNYAIGYKAANRNNLLNHFAKVKIKAREELSGYDFHVSYH